MQFADGNARPALAKVHNRHRRQLQWTEIQSENGAGRKLHESRSQLAYNCGEAMMVRPQQLTC
jgi:hypothetical protein